MSARINICGIDTSTLPKLSHDQQMKLLNEARSGSKAARDQFIMANLRLVLSVIQRFYSKKDNADDLFQVGTIGLIKALEQFRHHSVAEIFDVRSADDNRRNTKIHARQFACTGKQIAPRHGV